MQRLVIAALLLLLPSSACTKNNKAFCCTSESDCASVGVTDGVRNCEAAFACVNHTCTVPLDAPTPQCTTDNDCSGATPHCGPDMTCVECVNNDQCPMTAPVCTSNDHRCHTCMADAECSSEVCELSTGMCVAEPAVVYASPSGSATATCAQNDPCSIQRAFIVTDATRNTVHLAAGTYNANVVVANKTVNVRGTGATISATTGPTVTVSDRARLTMVGAIIVNAATTGKADAIDCESTNGVDTPILSLDSVQAESIHTAVDLNQCSATISRSKLHATGSSPTLAGAGSASASIDRTSILGGGYVVASTSGAVLHIANSIVGNPASGNDAFFGLGGAIDTSFSTIVNAVITCGSGAAVCSGASPNGVCIDNSIIANLKAGPPADTISGAACLVSWSVVYPQTTALNGGNNKPGMNPMLADPANSDYHLHTGSPAIDAADPSAADAIDFDGIARPQGGRNDMGAFELKP